MPGAQSSVWRHVWPRRPCILAARYLFEKIEQRAEHKEVGIVVSFLVIYLDQATLRDTLASH